MLCGKYRYIDSIHKADNETVITGFHSVIDQLTDLLKLFYKSVGMATDIVGLG